MDNEKIIVKIKKVLELAKNNPSPEEAKAAALQAQKLLAKYHIDMAEVEDIDLDASESIDEVKVFVGTGKKWKYTLAGIIARNFRCRHFYYGKSTVVFYGHKTDAEVASAAFKSLFNLGNKLAQREYLKVKKESGLTDGVFNSYVIGFCSGIESALSVQCTALVLTVPEDVNDAYENRLKGCKKHKSVIDTGKGFHAQLAAQRGFEAGKQAIENRRLEVGN